MENCDRGPGAAFLCNIDGGRGPALARESVQRIAASEPGCDAGKSCARVSMPEPIVTDASESGTVYNGTYAGACWPNC